jgi:hypothetical protein
MRYHFPTRLVIFVGLMAATNVQAQDQTAEEVLKAEVLSCTDRAMNLDLGHLDGLDWVASCKQRSEDLCAAHPRTKDELTADGQIRVSCDEYSQVAWKGVADQIKAKLIARWQVCAVPDEVKSAMIDRVERTDAAAYALFEATCDYDSAQWRAFGEHEMAILRARGCQADSEAVRSTLHYWNFIRDAGCDVAGDTP